MCHQTVSLVQVKLERRGIVTVSPTVMPDITRKLGAAGALAVEAPLGAPTGPPHDVDGHRAVLGRMLALAERTDVPLLDTFWAPAAHLPGYFTGVKITPASMRSRTSAGIFRPAAVASSITFGSAARTSRIIAIWVVVGTDVEPMIAPLS